MPDEQIKELISAYLDGELSVDERAQIERHLADSVECQQFLDHLRRQQVALRSIPRHKLRVDLSQRVLQAIERARPAVHPVTSSTAVLPREQAAKRTWWRTWQGMAMAAGTVAGLILVVVYLTSADRQGPDNTNHNLVVQPGVPGGSNMPGGPNLPDAVELPEKIGPEDRLPAETLVALGEFQELVQFVVIYDITVTPQAQQNKVFEGWMAKAGIPVKKGIAIDQRLAKEILAARFIGDAKIAAGVNPKSTKRAVEMFFVRGAIEQIDAVYREYLAIRDQPNPEVSIRLDLAAAPRELHVFLQLNKAAGLDLTQMKSNPRSLRTPGAFPIQFQLPLHSVSLPRLDSDGSLAASAISDAGTSDATSSNSRDAAAVGRPARISEAAFQLAVADSPFALAQNSLTDPAQPEGVAPFADPNDPGQAGQALFIIRNLPEDPK